jgi:hypothetical protein
MVNSNKKTRAINLFGDVLGCDNMQETVNNLQGLITIKQSIFRGFSLLFLLIRVADCTKISAKSYERLRS